MHEGSVSEYFGETFIIEVSKSSRLQEFPLAFHQELQKIWELSILKQFWSKKNEDIIDEHLSY